MARRPGALRRRTLPRSARLIPVLRAEGVRKSYGHIDALLGIDLAVDAGEIRSLLGPNGAGKTTFVGIVAGLRRPDAGTVTVGGVDVVRNPKAAHQHIGLAPQELGVYYPLTVRENLLLFGELAGLRRGELRRRIQETADDLNLADLLERRAGQLSGGERRRLHTAIALIHRPSLLLLDEPTVGADVPTRSRMLELVKRLASDGAAVVYTTHYLPEVETLGGSVAIMRSGTIIASGGVAELIARHARCIVELAFDGPAPLVDHADASVDGTTVRVRDRRARGHGCRRDQIAGARCSPAPVRRDRAAEPRSGVSRVDGPALRPRRSRRWRRCRCVVAWP